MFLSTTSSAIRLALLYLFASETSVLASYQVSTCTSFHVSFCVILIFKKMSLPHVFILSFFRFLFLHRFTDLSVLSNPLCLFKFSYPYLFLLLPFSIILIFHLSLSCCSDASWTYPPTTCRVATTSLFGRKWSLVSVEETPEELWS